MKYEDMRKLGWTPGRVALFAGKLVLLGVMLGVTSRGFSRKRWDGAW